MIAALELVVAVVVWVETSWFITVWRLQSSNKSAGAESIHCSDCKHSKLTFTILWNQNKWMLL